MAKANGVLFVDLFTPSQQLFEAAAKEGKPLTINTHYLTETGNKLLAPIMLQSIFGRTCCLGGDLEKLRDAVLDKDAKWFGRYRTVDGYNVYGGRSHEAMSLRARHAVSPTTR